MRTTVAGVVLAVAALLVGSPAVGAEPMRGGPLAEASSMTGSARGTSISGGITPALLNVGEEVVAAGRVTPAKRGTSVLLQSLNGTTWATLGRGSITRAGDFRIGYRPAQPGSWTLRAVAIRGGRARAVTANVAVTVHQQTYLSDLDPVSGGMSEDASGMAINGVSYTKSLSAYSDDSDYADVAEYSLAGAYGSFTATVGISDVSDSACHGMIEAAVDGRIVQRVEVDLGAPQALSVNLAGANRLVLRSTVRDADGTVVFGDPLVSTAASDQPLVGTPVEFLADLSPTSSDDLYRSFTEGPVNGVVQWHALSWRLYENWGDSDLDYAEFNLSRAYSRLQGTLGVHDMSVAPRPTPVRILLDGGVVWQGTVAAGQSVPIDLGVANALRMRIEVGADTNFANPDETVVFGDARLTR